MMLNMYTVEGLKFFFPSFIFVIFCPERHKFLGKSLRVFCSFVYVTVNLARPDKFV